MNGLDSLEASRLDTRFEATVRATFTVLAVATADVDRAKTFLANHRSGPRAGDALHLAIAARNGARSVCSFDRTLAIAGWTLGLPVNTGLPMTTP